MSDEQNFRASFARVAAWIENYLHDNRHYPVLSRSRPGDIVRALPQDAPQHGEPWSAILDDFEHIIMPGITHWNHPRFFAYFAISASPITILAEALAGALDVNAMVWRTSPAATELEDVTLEWLRRLLGLADSFHGIVYDTASIGGFTALAAAREALDVGIREKGMAGREDLRRLRVYISPHTHSHIEKGAIALGIGRENVIHVPVDDAYAMRPDALHAALSADVHAGFTPMCVVATVGTTSTTARDPVRQIAEACKKFNVWMHIDAAYAGPAAILPEFRWLLEGAEMADSVVVNPHKWLFVPVDLSVLYVKNLDILKRAFSLDAVYLELADGDVRNYMDYGLQLGRRFRALKLWFAMRALGVEGMQERLRRHIALAQAFAAWVKGEQDWEVVAPHPLSVVCFRHKPDGLTDTEADALNERILEAANASGEIFISSTRLHGHLVLRLAIGNERTTREDVQTAWDVLRRVAKGAVAA